MTLDKNYWKSRYQQSDTPWDAKNPTTPICRYFAQLPADARTARILVPGGGSGYEAEWLFQNGFTNVVLCDWAEEPLEDFARRVPDFPKGQLWCADFFDLQPDALFDYIVEQTFFCALPPAMRPQYAAKMHQLLAPTGKLVGLLFRFPLTEQGPPFGGSREEYQGHFSPHFAQISIEPCLDSIKPRSGNEFWIELSQRIAE